MVGQDAAMQAIGQQYSEQLDKQLEHIWHEHPWSRRLSELLLQRFHDLKVLEVVLPTSAIPVAIESLGSLEEEPELSTEPGLPYEMWGKNGQGLQYERPREVLGQGGIAVAELVDEETLVPVETAVWCETLDRPSDELHQSNHRLSQDGQRHHAGCRVTHDRVPKEVIAALDILDSTSSFPNLVFWIGVGDFCDGISHLQQPSPLDKLVGGVMTNMTSMQMDATGQASVGL